MDHKAILTSVLEYLQCVDRSNSLLAGIELVEYSPLTKQLSGLICDLSRSTAKPFKRVEKMERGK